MKYALILVLLSGCASLKNVDDTIDSKGTTQNGLVGIKNGKAIIQESTNAADELRTQQWKNNNLEDTLKDMSYGLKRCREEVADSRLGGSGEITEIPEVDNLKNPTTMKEEFGVAKNGDLKVVKQQDFMEKLKSERQYEVSLLEAMKIIKKNNAECGRKYAKARLAHGLPANRFQGRGVISGGVLTSVIEENENSLDDAFRIAASKKPPVERAPAATTESTEGQE